MISRLNEACDGFSLTISQLKTNVSDKGVPNTPMKNMINNRSFYVVYEFTHLGSKITDDMSIDNELSRSIGLAATNLKSYDRKCG